MIKDKQFYKFFVDLLLCDSISISFNEGYAYIHPCNDLNKFTVAINEAKNLNKSGFMSDSMLNQFINELIEKFAKTTE